MKKKIDDVLKKSEISFDDEFSSKIFDSHMNSLLDRIESQEVLESDESEYLTVMNEISPQALDIATDLMSIVFDEKQQPESKMELVLIATHIQNSMNNKKEKEESQ